MTAAWPKSARERLVDLVGDTRQLASVRQVEMQDGAERGVRALLFSTGGGLDFWVLQERSLDIGSLHWRGTPLAWSHPSGFAHPALNASSDDGGTGIERALGGFLATCGLDNVRQPRDGLPLHGTLPFTPARLIACGEDWTAATPVLFAEGEMVTAHLGRSCFRLRRRIEAPIGGTHLSISDSIENIAPRSAEMMVLYHINFGFPAVARDTHVALNGMDVPMRSVPAEGKDIHEADVICHPAEDSGGRFSAELTRLPSGEWQGVAATITGDACVLPFVQFWRDARKRRNVIGIEPANCGRNADGTSLPGTTLEPGERWSSEIRITFSSPQNTNQSGEKG